MLTLSGQHMDGVLRVAVKHKGVHVIGIEVRDANHLFVLLRIAADAEPGTMMLQLYSRFMTTFAAVPMLKQNGSLASEGELKADQ